MTITHVTEYNRKASIKYAERCRSWNREQGGFPQAAFYFYSYRNQLRKTGYVLEYPLGGDRTGSHWFKTKREAVEYSNKKLTERNMQMVEGTDFVLNRANCEVLSKDSQTWVECYQ